MRCKKCGHEIPSDTLYCRYCGEEFRIVPDYNPLEDMLAAQIKSSINENNTQYTETKIRQETRARNTNVIRNNSNAADKKKNIDEREARRRQAERRRELKRKRRRRVLLALGMFLLAVAGICIFLYQTSYTGIINKGNKAFTAGEYTKAKECYEKAVSKKPKLAEAYVGLSKIYILKKDIVRAEKIFLEAIEQYSDSSAIYEACIQFYLDTNQAMEIPLLIDEANSKVQDDLKDYIVEKPEFSLESGTVYDDVQQLTIISDNTIYYTTNGTNPNMNSIKFTEPVQLDEGETTIKAIAVNKKGIPSLPSEEEYIIELPIEDAPAVSPSTGQYDVSMKIEIKVPDGYTAYYTMDGSTPTTASTKYYGPIDMPEHNTLFKAILVNSAGRSSGVTTRNYILEIPEEEE